MPNKQRISPILLASACAFVLVGILFPAHCSAQLLRLFDIDTSAFPEVRAKYYAFDDKQQQLYHVASELSIRENGVLRAITSVTCPAPASQRAISSVLTIDISQSMRTGLSSVTNLEMARAANLAWIAAMPLGKSECAITAFDDANYFIQDFTTNAAKLTSGINGLKPRGGTDYNMGLIKAPAGALQATLAGQHQKVIVFLTDGRSETVVDEAAIIAEAARQSCIIFVVTINLECPLALKNICAASGGFAYSNIGSIPEIEFVYREILGIALSGTPCTIAWQGFLCPGGDREVELNSPIGKDTSTYELDDAKAVKLEFLPTAVFFRPKALFAPYDTTITVTASNGDMMVTDIRSTNPAYTIAPKSFALTAGQSIMLTVSYSPPDSGYTFTEFTFLTSACTEYFYASGGYAGKPATNPTLRLLEPNGPNALIAGFVTKIKWTGAPASGSFKLEYSTNSGTNWIEIAHPVIGLEYDWRVPSTLSTTCLVRVSSLSPTGGDATGRVQSIPNNGTDLRWSQDGLRIAALHTSGVTVTNPFSGQHLVSILPGEGVGSYDWSEDGQLIATVGSPVRTAIWNANTGMLIHKIGRHNRGMHHAKFSPDATKVSTVGLDTWGTIWNTASGDSLVALQGHLLPTTSADWNQQGTKIVTVSADASAIVYDAVTGSVIPLRLADHAGAVTGALWNKDGTRIATLGVDGMLNIYSATPPHALLHSLPGHTSRRNTMKWSPDGVHVAGCSTTEVFVWNSVTGNKVHTLRGHGRYMLALAWSPDGKKIGSVSNDAFAIVWDVNTGKEIRRLTPQYPPTFIAFSPKGEFIATSGSVITIWGDPETPSMTDVSDALFAIVGSVPYVINIDMQQVAVGESKDSVVPSLVSNLGAYPLAIDSIVITDTSNTFTIVSGSGPYVLAASATSNIELRFKPKSVGIKSATMYVYTSAGRFTSRLVGEGITPRLVIVNKLIDFGRVLLGDSKTLTQVVTVRNPRVNPITVSNVVQAGPNLTDFSSAIIGQSFTLQPSAEQLIDIRFDARALGRTTGELHFEYPGTGSPASIVLFAEVVASTATRGKALLQVGSASARVGDLIDIPITLVSDSNLLNTGATALNARLRFESALLDPQPPLSPGTVSNLDRVIDITVPLQPGANNVLRTLPFRATSSLDSSTVISLESITVLGGDVTITAEPGSFQLLPTPVDPIDTAEHGTALLRVGSATALVGQRINIPIILVADSNLAATLATSITGQLRFNATLLEPLAPFQFIPLGGDLGGINITLPLSPRTSDTLATMPFRTALGNDSVCALTLENMQAVGGSVTITSEPGIFKLEGICFAGGPRLINPTGQVDLSNASPNPIVNGYTDVTVETSEVGTISLILSDMQGRVVRSFLNGELDSGRRILALDFMNVASGTYMLTLRTPTERRTIRIEVAM